MTIIQKKPCGNPRLDLRLTQNCPGFGCRLPLHVRRISSAAFECLHVINHIPVANARASARGWAGLLSLKCIVAQGKKEHVKRLLQKGWHIRAAPCSSSLWHCAFGGSCSRSLLLAVGLLPLLLDSIPSEYDLRTDNVTTVTGWIQQAVANKNVGDHPVAQGGGRIGP